MESPWYERHREVEEWWSGGDGGGSGGGVGSRGGGESEARGREGERRGLRGEGDGRGWWEGGGEG